MRTGLVYVLFVCLWPGLLMAQYYTENWRQDALEMIEDGRYTIAHALLEEAESRKNFMNQPIEKINQGRFLGDAFYKLGKKERAAQNFEDAMKASLQLKPVWRSLSAVISVLELQATHDDKAMSQKLIQQSLNARLLPNMAKDRYATEIGRYVQRFEHASRAQIYELIGQLRVIDKPKVRKKAFYALTELDFSEFTGEGRYEQMRLPIGMQAFERFLWFSVMAKYFAESEVPSQLNQQVAGMKTAYERLTQEQQKKYRKIYRKISKLSASKSIVTVSPKTEPKVVRFSDHSNEVSEATEAADAVQQQEPSDVPLSGSNLEAIYYGKEAP